MSGPGSSPDRTAIATCWTAPHDGAGALFWLMPAAATASSPYEACVSASIPFFLSRLDDVLSSGDTGLSRTITEVYRSNVRVTPAACSTAPSSASSAPRWASTG
ncbi:hypothetical protein [Amycolatopsis sp. cmx-4-83]|uniref:hypothetical protein n=1 Tax=Amycolatopsis sp. cmx-4-83 TaxID=2790940 RepID=UPI003978EE5F